MLYHPVTPPKSRLSTGTRHGPHKILVGTVSGRGAGSRVDVLGWGGEGSRSTKVDIARRMGEGFSPFDDGFTSCGRVEVMIFRTEQIQP